ncbi:hypothetical protein TNCV_1111361 [Trichonephila clavipes]|nr:hypothetical protein TNCV_1111361 [Trichonephila clavipes]
MRCCRVAYSSPDAIESPPCRGAHVVVVVVSFPKGRNESCHSLRQVGFLSDRWRHHLSPPLQFKHGTGGERKHSPAPCTRGFFCDHSQDCRTH